MGHMKHIIIINIVCDSIVSDKEQRVVYTCSSIPEILWGVMLKNFPILVVLGNPSVI